MEKRKRGQAGIVSALIVILVGSLVFVNAAVTNSTNGSFVTSLNDSLNMTFVALKSNETINETESDDIVLENQTIDNLTLTNESVNLTIPIENLSIINQSDNLILNETANNQTYVNQTINITIINESVNLSSRQIGNATSLNATEVINYSTDILQNQSKVIFNKTAPLAKIFNEDNLEFDKEYKKKYLDLNKNFSNLNFKKIAEKEDIVMTVGARINNIKGLEINNKNFAIDLITCNSYERYCAFRINGVPTKKLFSFEEFGTAKKTSFDLDANYIIKINSVNFDFCDNRRFCHLGYEGYHKVDVSIEEKK